MSVLSQDDLLTIAETLSGGAVDASTPAHGGGNNRIYKVEGANGPAALKFYLPQDEDPRDRLGQEYAALDFLSQNGVTQVPTPIGQMPDRHCAMYQWVAGERVTSIGNEEVDVLADFLAQLQDMRGVEGVLELHPASACCFSLQAVVDQLMARLARLERLQGAAGSSAELQEFIGDAYEPTVNAAVAKLQVESADLGLDITTEIDQSQRALSPSDFGYHNALRDGARNIVFIDFEYFGWDDPVKMIADVMWHAGMNLNDAQGERFYQRIAPVFAQNDDTFTQRFNLLYPLYGLIWCAIVLNEFLPERWARREAAGHTDAELSRKRQLDKASTLYQRLIS